MQRLDERPIEQSPRRPDFGLSEAFLRNVFRGEDAGAGKRALLWWKWRFPWSSF